ncbi:phenylacetate--CoA ligase family protein [Novosphingobium panipatense]|uniref:Phenylacetate-CoA ligase n=1 Tax=Novosphingobium panipatense TaxID=428991 RepID=A0ABY1QWN3_9SPHN|nr:hypothetical protein [Novosphingobium panipatense]SMP82626.1 phenylacetate-CoA ligase [Novosphingobium panipatense]
MKNFVLRHAPIWMQNAAISFYNWRQWRLRRAGVYKERVRFFSESANWDRQRWGSVQESMLHTFLRHAKNSSPWYSTHGSSSFLEDFPFLTKSDIIKNLKTIKTIPYKSGIASYTGGTTGASMKVLFTAQDMQTRFAMLDWFRSLYGWELGKRTAWFSGKSLVRERDIRQGIVWRDDWITKTRFFSTFHINETNFDAYWQGLIEFDPEFIVGFPSSLIDILQMAKTRGLSYPSRVKAFFPTAETVLPLHRDLAREILGCSTHDQYASSEGAPFILECPSGSLHAMPLSGVFEVVDDDMLPSRSGELVVTSFSTYGTPLIRYRVGDAITFADAGVTCGCGWTFPLVESIEGRSADFVWSPELGRINLGNISNCTKGVAGIISFQIVQNAPDKIDVRVHATSEFDETNHRNFVEALRLRTGSLMNISVEVCDDLGREKSGKFRIVKNSLTSDQMIWTPRRTV